MSESRRSVHGGYRRQPHAGSFRAKQAPSDADLVRWVRRGDSLSLVELWYRHSGGALRLSRSLCDDWDDAEAMAYRAFRSVASVIRRGLGPYVFFRSYLYGVIVDDARSRLRTALWEQGLTTLIDPEIPRDQAVRSLERMQAKQAFDHLGARDQALLWHSRIERDRDDDLGRILGVERLHVPSLLARAEQRYRSQLASSWARSADRDPTSPECSTAAPELARHAHRPSLTGRPARASVASHVDSCVRCRTTLRWLDDPALALRAAVLPAVIGTDLAARYLTVLDEAPWTPVRFTSWRHATSHHLRASLAFTTRPGVLRGLSGAALLTVAALTTSAVTGHHGTRWQAALSSPPTAARAGRSEAGHTASGSERGTDLHRALYPTGGGTAGATTTPPQAPAWAGGVAPLPSPATASTPLADSSGAAAAGVATSPPGAGETPATGAGGVTVPAPTPGTAVTVSTGAPTSPAASGAVPVAPKAGSPKAGSSTAGAVGGGGGGSASGTGSYPAPPTSTFTFASAGTAGQQAGAQTALVFLGGSSPVTAGSAQDGTTGSGRLGGGSPTSPTSSSTASAVVPDPTNSAVAPEPTASAVASDTTTSDSRPLEGTEAPGGNDGRTTVGGHEGPLEGTEAQRQLGTGDSPTVVDQNPGSEVGRASWDDQTSGGVDNAGDQAGAGDTRHEPPAGQAGNDRDGLQPAGSTLASNGPTMGS